MNHSPSYSYSDFTQHGFQVIGEVGRNHEGGRITWKAKQLSTNETVIIKQFCFAHEKSNWDSYKACEKEIRALQRLNHPKIPRYLGDFQTSNGFCLVQEYKHASK